MKYLNSIILLFFLVLCCLNAFADHIVGVDLAIAPVSTSKANFKLIMNIFIDHSIQPDPLKEKEKVVQIYRKRDGKFMTTITLYGYVFSEVHLTYTNPKCAEKFNLHIYTQHLEREVMLKTTDYDDEQGYIAVFDRCCRGKVITNIIDSENTPMSVIMEFPSLKTYPKYTSPEFSTPNGEFACVNEPFQMSFDIKNSNNKTINYKLVESLSGFTKKGAFALGDPPPFMKVQPPVNWAVGSNGANPIPASKNLSIDSKTGLLSVTPTQKGVYCFAVMVEDYVGNVRIGYTTRDYTLVVVDCPINKPPLPVINYQSSPTQEITLCPGTNATLETQDDPTWNFRWQNNNDNIPNETKNSIAVKDTGTYRVIKSLKTDCSDESISTTVKVKLANGATLIKIKSNQMSACEGEKIKLELQDPTQTADWYFVSTFLKKDKTIDADKSGDYIAKTSGGSSTCATSQDNILIKILPKPSVTAPSQPLFEICTGDKIDLETQSNTDYIYQWYKNNTIITGATLSKFQVGEIGNFTVKVSYGDIICESVSQVFKVGSKASCGGTTVIIPPTTGGSDQIIYTPKAFSPNNDNLNETWQIFNIEKFPDAEVSIYNRWGELLFYSKGYTEKWDGTFGGKKVPADSYSFVIKPNFESKSDIRGVIHIIY